MDRKQGHVTTPPIDSVGTLVSRQLDKLSGRKRKEEGLYEKRNQRDLWFSKFQNVQPINMEKKKIELSVECRFSDQKCRIKFSTSLCSNRFRANSIGTLLYRLIFDFYYELCLETPTVRTIVVLQSRASLHLS